jgi:putative transposase
MRVKQAYRFALDPSPAQERALRSHAGAARFAWNWGLAKCQERYTAEGRWYSGVEMHKLWNAEKKADPALSWWAENSKCAYQEAFRNLDRALHDFVKSRKRQRRGRRLGFPKFKKRGKTQDSFRLSTGAMRCERATVTLPKLGTIRTHESTRKLARHVENGTARILSATVSRTAQRWYVSFTIEVDRVVPDVLPRPGFAIGVDLGVMTLLTGADDRGNVIKIAGPRPAGCAAPTAPIPASTLDRRTGGSLRPGWHACTPRSRTCAQMRCTRPPHTWPAAIRPSSSRT